MRVVIVGASGSIGASGNVGTSPELPKLRWPRADLQPQLRGRRQGREAPTPPLDPPTGGPDHLGELATGIGRRR